MTTAPTDACNVIHMVENNVSASPVELKTAPGTTHVKSGIEKVGLGWDWGWVMKAFKLACDFFFSCKTSSGLHTEGGSVIFWLILHFEIRD